MTTETLEVRQLMEARDPSAYLPIPQIGETPAAYWIRALKHQTWEQGNDAARDDAAIGTEYDTRTRNPYGESP